MAWLVILTILLTVVGVTALIEKPWKLRKHWCYRHRSARDTLEWQACSNGYGSCRLEQTRVTIVMLIILGAFMGILFVFALVYTSTIIHDSNDVENSYFVLQEAMDQRDALLAEFEQVLNNKDYIALMNASTPSDVQFLATRPQVSDFLLGKADRLISVNTKVFEIRDGLLEQSKEICNYIQNPFLPYIPGMLPECKLDEVSNLVNKEPIG